MFGMKMFKKIVPIRVDKSTASMGSDLSRR